MAMEGKPRILLVDDSPAYRRVIQTMLGPRYDFAQAQTAEEALESVSRFLPDLVISDLIRPRELNARVTSLLRLRRATLELAAANAKLMKAQAELVRAEKLASLGQLVAGIAHELNNPLNYIYGNTEFLRDYVRTFVDLLDRVEAGLDLSPEQIARLEDWKKEKDLEFVRTDLGKLLEGVRLGAERAAEIVRGLRAFARVGSAAEIGECDLGETINVALTVLRHELRDRIRVHKQIEAHLPRLRADASRM